MPGSPFSSRRPPAAPSPAARTAWPRRPSPPPERPDRTGRGFHRHGDLLRRGPLVGGLPHRRRLHRGVPAGQQVEHRLPVRVAGGVVVRVRSGGHLEPQDRARAEADVTAPRGTSSGGVVCGSAPRTASICSREAGPRTARARVWVRTVSVRVSSASNCSASTTVTWAARPCRSGIRSSSSGSGLPSAAARWPRTPGRSSRIHSGRRMSSGTRWPLCRARLAAISRRSVSCAAHSSVASAPPRPDSTARTPPRPARAPYSPVPPPSTTMTSPSRRAWRAIERTRVVVPPPGCPTASRCGSVERPPVRQTTGEASTVTSPSRTGTVRETASGSVKPSTVSPGAVTKRWAAIVVGSASSTVMTRRLASSSQPKWYSRPRPDLVWSNCSIRERAAASPSVKYAG